MADTTVSLQALINNSLARAKDSNKTQWTDAQMLIFGNKAVSFIHKILIREQNELAISEGTITMVAATQEYTLSGNLDDFWGMAPDGVYFSSVVKPLIPIPYEDKIREGTGTTDIGPLYYYLTATSLGVVNIPTATSVATWDTLNCRYFAKNTALTLTDSMPYKNVFNDQISAFMDRLAFMKAEVATEEITETYNVLEQETLKIIQQRLPL